jgi:exostosin family protein
MAVGSGPGISCRSNNPRMKVCLLDPRKVLRRQGLNGDLAHDRIVDCAAKSAVVEHTLVDSPHEADLVLTGLQSTPFGPHFEAIRSHPLLREIREKLIVYAPGDNQYPALRGLYTCVSQKWIERGWASPVHYLSMHVDLLHLDEKELENKDIACSFVGTVKNHPVRTEVMKLPSEKVYLFDSSRNRQDAFWWLEKNRAELERHFRDVLVRSRFVICPRGVSPASIRLFQAMEAASVPVIVSDGFVPPPGPDWNSFCLFVPEAAVAMIPDAIETWRDSAVERGRIARDAWKKHFSEEASFNYLVSSGARLLEKKCSKPMELVLGEYLEPGQMRAKAREFKRRLLRRLKPPAPK